MSTGGPNRPGDSNVNAGRSIGFNDGTVKFSKVGNLPASEQRSSFHSRLVKMFFHPMRYFREEREARNIARNLDQQGRHLMDRKVDGLHYQFEDIQYGLHGVENKTVKHHKLHSFDNEPQAERNYVNTAQLARYGEDRNMPPELKITGAYKEASDGVPAFKDNLERLDKQNETLKEAYKDVFESVDTNAAEKIGKAQKKVNELRDEIRLLAYRKKSVPWYGFKEKSNKWITERLSIFEIIKQQDKAYVNYNKAREVLSNLKEVENAKHDHKRHPRDVMSAVNTHLDTLNSSLQSVVDLVESKDRKVGDAQFMLWVKDDVLAFRQETNKQLESLKDADVVDVRRQIVELRARQIAGQALDRMLRKSKNLEDFTGRLNDYKEGELCKDDLELVRNSGIQTLEKSLRLSSSESESKEIVYHSDSYSESGQKLTEEGKDQSLAEDISPDDKGWYDEQERKGIMPSPPFSSGDPPPTITARPESRTNPFRLDDN